MKIEHTTLKDCFVLTPAIYKDERGTFCETYNEVLFEKVTGQKVNFIQDNQSTPNLGTLRGLQQQLFVPRGFAHGFITLSPTSKFAYKCDNFYDKDSERGIIYNDATLSLDWHLQQDKFILSEKDQILPTFLEATSE